MPLEDGGEVCERVQRCQTIIEDDGVSAVGAIWTGRAENRPVVRPGGVAQAEETLDHAEDLRENPVEGVVLTDVTADHNYGNFGFTGEWVECRWYDVNGTAWTRTSYGPVRGVPAMINVGALHDRANAQAAPPDPAQLGRTPLVDDVAIIVNMPTWFWVDPDYWRTYRGSATSSNGRITVSVETRPVDSVWDTGEGLMTCDAGVEYTPATPDPERGSDCIHWYRMATPDGHHTVTGTVNFRVNWYIQTPHGRWLRGTNNGDRSNSWDVEIGEIQALISSPAPIEQQVSFTGDPGTFSYDLDTPGTFDGYDTTGSIWDN